VAKGKLASLINYCPVCGCEIVVDDITRGHDNYAECLDALATRLFAKMV
jgi:hypothetical protein